MFATISGSGSYWTVKAPGRMISGFGSYQWAVRWCETMGWAVQTDPEEGQK